MLDLHSAGAFAGPLYWLLMSGLQLKCGSTGKEVEQSCGIVQADSDRAHTTLLGPKLGP